MRVSPKEIIVADVATFRDIHRIGTPFVKSEYYKYLNPTEAGKPPYNVFAEVNVTAHSKRRRLLARGFSVSFLRSNWEPVVLEKVAFAVERMKVECGQDGEVDVLKWWLFMASDVISQLMFGESFDTLKLGHVSEQLLVYIQAELTPSRKPNFSTPSKAPRCPTPSLGTSRGCTAS